MLTLFRPATGAVRATGVTHAPTTVLHPWLIEQLTQVLAALPDRPLSEPEQPTRAQWAMWRGHEPHEALPPLRLILVWDNLAGHHRHAIVDWVFQHGVLPLDTPLGGSWLTMAESVQRIIVGRARAGQHPHAAAEVIQWLDETVAGWNTDPTPVVWDGTRRQRRQRARQRRLGGSGAALPNHQLIAA